VRFEFVGILGLVASAEGETSPTGGLHGCGYDARYVNSQTVAYETPIDGLCGRYESRNRNRFTSFLLVGLSDTGYFNYGIFGLQGGVVNGQKGG